MAGPPQGQIKHNGFFVINASIACVQLQHAAPQLCCSIADSTYIHDSGGPTHATGPSFPNSYGIGEINESPQDGRSGGGLDLDFGIICKNLPACSWVGLHRDCDTDDICLLQLQVGSDGTKGEKKNQRNRGSESAWLHGEGGRMEVGAGGGVLANGQEMMRLQRCSNVQLMRAANSIYLFSDGLTVRPRSSSTPSTPCGFSRDFRSKVKPKMGVTTPLPIYPLIF